MAWVYQAQEDWRSLFAPTYHLPYQVIINEQTHGYSVESQNRETSLRVGSPFPRRTRCPCWGPKRVHPSQFVLHVEVFLIQAFPCRSGEPLSGPSLHSASQVPGELKSHHPLLPVSVALRYHFSLIPTPYKWRAGPDQRQQTRGPSRTREGSFQGDKVGNSGHEELESSYCSQTE